MKKLISLTLTLLMLIPAFSVMAYANNDTSALPFTDVKKGAWYYEGIQYCYLFEYVKGMTKTTFEPAGTLTRAQFVQILSGMAGAELDGYKSRESGFEDVGRGHWYNAAVCWAVEMGYVKGVSATRFAPNEPITREQLVRLLYLFAQSQGLDVKHYADLSGYEDAKAVSKWAYKEMRWAVEAGIVTGTSDTTLSPKDTATRAQACLTVMNYNDFDAFGYRTTDGAYRVIADYIITNADSKDTTDIQILEQTYDGHDAFLEYYRDDDVVYIRYRADPYMTEDGDTTSLAYREIADMHIYTLTDKYDFAYYCEGEDEDGLKDMYGFGYITAEGFEIKDTELNGYTEDELNAAFDRCAEFMHDRIAEILAEENLTLDDFFIKH